MLVPEVASRAPTTSPSCGRPATTPSTRCSPTSPSASSSRRRVARRRTCDETAGGTFADFGVDLHVGGHTDELPLSLTVGAWLLARAGWVGPRTYSTGTPDIEGRVALLVMADGSAKRTTEAPGYFDERAIAYDACDRGRRSKPATPVPSRCSTWIWRPSSGLQERRPLATLGRQ